MGAPELAALMLQVGCGGGLPPPPAGTPPPACSHAPRKFGSSHGSSEHPEPPDASHSPGMQQPVSNDPSPGSPHQSSPRGSRRLMGSPPVYEYRFQLPGSWGLALPM